MNWGINITGEPGERTYLQEMGRLHSVGINSSIQHSKTQGIELPFKLIYEFKVLFISE